MEILLVDPGMPISCQYRADCPHCGDHSFPVEITGHVYIGHTTKTVFEGRRDPNPGESDDIVYLRTAKA